MKKLILILFCIINMNLFTESMTDFEFNFIQYEEELIKAHNLISKQQAIDRVYKSLVGIYSKMAESEFKQLLNNIEIILVEEITPVEARIETLVPYFYSVQVKSKDDRILTIYSINAETGKSEGGIIMDEKDTSDFIYLMNRNEVIEYARKYFDFPQDSKLIIRAIYDYSFYYKTSLPKLSGYWKYRITIENGIFNSPTLPAGINTIFITPFIEGYKGKKEKAAPDNNIHPLHKHRLYTYNTKQATDKAASKSAEAPAPEAKYIGLD